MDINYTLKEKAKDPNAAVITKSGISVDFTPQEMRNEQAQCEKFLAELNAKLDLEKAKMSNIAEHHPFVKEMSAQDLFTAHMYQEAKAFVDVIPSKVEEVTAQLEESRAELALISAMLGLDFGEKKEVSQEKEETEA